MCYLSGAGLIACKDMGVIEAFLCPWSPSSTFYKLLEIERPGQERLGYAHLAMSVGSASAVDALTMRLVNEGYQRLDGPRWTGDGCYESVILDPEGNRIEITV